MLPSWLKKAFGIFLDIVEMYIPILAFLIIFACFLLQIVSRYFLTPLMWPEELALICFLWVALLGALYAKRSNSMVCFSMLYDAVGPNSQRAMRLVGDTVLTVFLAISFVPTWNYVMFMGFKASPTIGIPLNIAYSCYLIFLGDIIIRYIVDIIRDLKSFRTGSEAI